MKVIFLKDVPKVGRRYDVKEVSDGYARNFLIPGKLAEVATEQAIKSIANKKKEGDSEQQIHQDLLEKNLQSLDGVRISVEEKANEKGHLFAGVHKDEIVKFSEEQEHIEIPADLIDLEEPIKTVGEHEIKVGKNKFTLEIKAKE